VALGSAGMVDAVAALEDDAKQGDADIMATPDEVALVDFLAAIPRTESLDWSWMARRRIIVI